MNDSFNESIYDTDYFDEVCEKGEVVRFGSIAVPVFFSVVFLLSLVGNILVLAILALYENLKSLTNILILNLAISDLVFTAGLPFYVMYHIWGWLFSEILCKIVTFVFFTGFYSSILFLTTMTVYRYVAVVHPLSDPGTQTFSTGVIVCLLLWMISVGAAMPSLLYSSLVTIPHQDKDSQGCEFNAVRWKDISNSQQNVFFLVAFVVTAFCYIRILGKIREARSNTRSRALKLIFCIVAVFFLGWVPYNVVIFMIILEDNQLALNDDCEASIYLEYAFQVSRLFAFCHCCLNPVFYAFVGVKFRRHFKFMLHQMCARHSPAEEQQIRMQNFSRGSMY